MKVVAVSADLMVDIVTSRTFRRALSEAGNRTRRTGHETDLIVMKKYASDDFGVPWVQEGGCAAMWNGNAPTEIQSAGGRRFRALLENTYPLFEIHFHPRYDEPIIPSFPDLHGIHHGYIDEIDKRSSYEVRTVSGIAQVDDRGNVELLLIQPLMPFCPGEGEEGMLEQLVRATSTEEVAKLLRDSGVYLAEVVHFHQCKLRESDRGKLGKFAFTPRHFHRIGQR